MAFNDSMDPTMLGPRRRGLIAALDPGSAPAIAGGVGSLPGAPQRDGDYIPAQAVYDTSGMSPAQQQQWQAAIGAQHGRDASTFAADNAYLAAHGGNWGDYHPTFDPRADPSPTGYGGRLVGGSQFTGAPDGSALQPGQGYAALSVNGGPSQPHYTDNSPAGVAASQAALDQAVAAGSAPAAGAADYGRLGGYDLGKLNDPNKHDAKYDIGRTLAQFDPKAGLTPDVLAALNKLGYGTFSGAGDGLSLAGLTPAGRAAGLSGDYTGADFVTGFHSNHPTWAYDDPVADAQAGGGRAPAGGMSPTTALPMIGGGLGGGTLSGNATENAQAALAKLQQPGLLQQLIAALSSGGK